MIGSGDEVCYGLSLRKVKPAIHESTLCELARTCKTTSFSYQKFKQAAKNIGGAMARDFHSVLPCIAVRGLKESDEGFVKDFIAVMNRAEVLGPRLYGFGQGGTELSDGGKGIGSGDPHDTQRAAWGCCYCTDGLGSHFPIFFNCFFFLFGRKRSRIFVKSRLNWMPAPCVVRADFEK